MFKSTTLFCQEPLYCSTDFADNRGGIIVKQQWLLAMLLILSVALLASSITYATPNQSAPEIITNTTINSSITENTSEPSIIQSTTTDVVNDTEKNQKLSTTNKLSVKTQNSSYDDSKETENIQNATAAAADDSYKNVHGLWISADEVTSVHPEELLKAGITDIFVKANRLSSPTYQSVLNTILSKFQGTGIRVHAWVNCFLDAQGNWVDPQGSYKYTVKIPYKKKWYRSWTKVAYKVTYKSWIKVKGKWNFTWKTILKYKWKSTWKYYWLYRDETRIGNNNNFKDALVNYCADLTRNYNIAGIHLDYIRYPGTAYKYSGGTEAITDFVKRVYNTVKSIKPKAAVSAALMPEGSMNGNYYGQDYAKLSPYLDFLVPMIYKGNYGKDTAWIGTSTAWIVNHSSKPVLAGIMVYRNDKNLQPLTSAEINQDIKCSISNGASGFVLFRYALIDKAFFKNSDSDYVPVTYTVSQICEAAGRVNTFVKANNALPSYVQMGSLQITMPQFLRLLCTSTLQTGSTTSIAIKGASTPENPSEDMHSGNLNKNEYLDLASRIKSFMDSNAKAPNYVSTTLGKIRYESLIYLYSRVMEFYGNKHVLPNYAVMNPWSTSNPSTPTTETITSELQKYLQLTKNCQSKDPRIIALAQSITSGKTSSYEKGLSIFNWVRNNLEYSWYYNSQKGAVNALLSKNANCCDHSNLIVALCRAAGVPARYLHGVCTFSSGTYGHVWAQIYANGKWYDADATSNRNELGVIRNWNTNSWTLKGTYAELPF